MPLLSDYITLAQSFKDNIKQVWSILEDEVNNDITLDDLDNVSKTSKEGLLLYIPAYMTWFFETYILNTAKSDIQAIIDNNISPTDPWWQSEMKKFQDGDSLLYDPVTRKYYYAVIDATKNIIKYCSVTSGGGMATIKVLKDGKVPVSTAEYGRIKAYMNSVQPSGANLSLRSINSDKLKLPTTVYYNALRNVSDIQPLVEAAVNGYLDNLSFNGEFNLNFYEDAIQAVADVKRVKLGDIQGRPDSEGYADITDVVYLTYSGAVEVDPDFPLSVVITYVPI